MKRIGYSIRLRPDIVGVKLENTLSIAVVRWCAWEFPNGRSPRSTYYAHGEVICEETETPNLAGVPAIQRRRLGKLARTVFHVLSKCTEPDTDEPVIFSSYLGEIQRTYAILNSIAANEEVSPAAFSLSVHNAIGGQWSVIRNVKAPILALAPPSNSPVPALLEAIGILEEAVYSAVNVVFYEEEYPAFFAAFFDSAPGPSALALRLVSAHENTDPGVLHFRLRQLPGNCSSDMKNDNCALLLKALSGQHKSVTIEEPQCSWNLELYR